MHLSAHAKSRCRQRGFSSERLFALLDNADTDFLVGGNCRGYRISRQAGLRGYDGISNFVCVVSENTGGMVTVAPIRKGRKGRRYRRRL